MVKFVGKNNRFSIAVFISGRGSNLESLIKYSKKKKSNFNVKLIVSNNKSANGLRLSKKFNIDKFIIKSFKIKKDRLKLIRFLKKKNIDLICLAGFMTILPSDFIANFKKRILNIHPSLLPKYKGLNTHFRALQNKEKFSGCTVHFVNKKLDSGKIVLQKKLKISLKENVKSLEKKILKIEHKIYPKAVEKVLINF